MKVSRAQPMILLWISLTLSACNASQEKPHGEPSEVTVTTVHSKPVTITQQYICRICSRRHIAVQSLAEGYLAAIPVREGQSVKQNDVLFQVRPLIDNNITVRLAPF
jgi:membrane fusion protein (multidrug efflux system)